VVLGIIPSGSLSPSLLFSSVFGDIARHVVLSLRTGGTVKRKATSSAQPSSYIHLNPYGLKFIKIDRLCLYLHTVNIRTLARAGLN